MYNIIRKIQILKNLDILYGLLLRMMIVLSKKFTQCYILIYIIYFRAER